MTEEQRAKEGGVGIENVSKRPKMTKRQKRQKKEQKTKEEGEAGYRKSVQGRDRKETKSGRPLWSS